MLCNLRFLPVLLLATLPHLTAAANECPDIPSPRAKKRMVHLENELRLHNALYYQKSRPVISDAQYDRLFAELVQMEQCFPGLATADSPTRKISNDSNRKALTLRHERPMLSLSSSTGPEAVEALLSRAKAMEQEPLLLVQPKVDGLPVELTYRSGRLISAATRGDGRQGADVTSRVKEIQGIPHELSGKFPKLVTVRGEIYADRGLMAKAAKGSMRNYATPRHFAAAALKSKHPDPIALAALRLFPFQWVDAEEGSGVTSDLAALGVLSLWGFPVRLDLTDQARNLGEIRTAYQKHLTWRDEQSFAADGIVAKLDDLSLRRRLGEGARAPFWAAAWKFPPETAQTLVREIRWNSGRTGRRTPVAELVPVSLGGVRVSRVSLSNAETVRRLGIAAGDQVLIGLVADIIPQVLEVKKKAGRTDGSDTTPAEAPESGMTDCVTSFPLP